jgi:hypothetical protein
MTDPNRPTRSDGRIDTGFDRRRVLQALGAGVGTAAVTGLGGAKSVKPAKIDEVPRTDENASGEEIHSVSAFRRSRRTSNRPRNRTTRSRR